MIEGIDFAEFARLLAQDEKTGIRVVRDTFFQALENHQVTICNQLLSLLLAMPSPYLQHEYEYLRAILYFDQRHYDQAESILRTLLNRPLQPLQRARTLLELGNQCNELGQFSEAEQSVRDALAIYTNLEDRLENILGQAKALNNLGIAICYQVEQGVSTAKRLDEALSCHQQALRLLQAEPLTPAIQVEIARNWHGIGKVYGQKKEPADALNAFDIYIKTRQELGHNGRYAMGLSDMAALAYQPLGQLAQAQNALDTAIALLQQQDDPLNLAEAFTRRGNLFANQRAWELALTDYESALTLTEGIRLRLTTPMSRISYRDTVEFIYQAPLTLQLQQNQPAAALTTSERIRSRVLVDLLSGQSVQPHNNIPKHLLLEHNRLRQELEQQYEQGSTPTQLEESLATLERQIELLDPTYADLKNFVPLSASEIQAKLPPNSALLTYVADTHDQLWAIVATNQGVQSTLLPKTSYHWLQTYIMMHQRTPDKRVQIPGELVLLPQGEAGTLVEPTLYPLLYQKLIQPIYEQIKDVPTLYIIPTGRLHYIPMGALTAEAYSSPPLLAAGRRVVYAPSATVLLNYCHQRAASPHQGLLAVVPDDPDLHLTIGVVQQIAQHEEDVALVGESATREAFLAQAGNHQMVCFLGHASFNAVHPMLSYLKLTNGSTLQASEMLRDLRLHADLVVLAACESGRSHILRGDEILGLSRALLYAGASSLLVTLWKVHELPTRLLLEKFFAELGKHSINPQPFDPASALSTAQAWLRELTYTKTQQWMKDWGELSTEEIDQRLIKIWQITHAEKMPNGESQLFLHPFFWSPFILIGDQH